MFKSSSYSYSYSYSYVVWESLGVPSASRARDLESLYESGCYKVENESCDSTGRFHTYLVSLIDVSWKSEVSWFHTEMSHDSFNRVKRQEFDNACVMPKISECLPLLTW